MARHGTAGFTPLHKDQRLERWWEPSSSNTRGFCAIKKVFLGKAGEQEHRALQTEADDQGTLYIAALYEAETIGLVEL